MSEAGERPSQRVPAAVGKPVGFDVAGGKGCVVLTLEDGAVLHVHPIVLDVTRTDATDERGQPVYSVQAGMAVRLMKPPGEG
jgi:hypothetical protein